MSVVGRVWLVGAGPGDPGLITVAGLEALGRADVVVYDRLASAALLDCAPASALRIDAGKRAGAHTLPQDAINDLLVEHARAGRRVVRLKGGDPFVFGRGGEEALALAAAGVPCTVIPGVTSAVAGPASAGIPLTHRGVSSSFAVVSGHAAEDDPAAQARWRDVAAAADTLVVLMTGARLEGVAAALLAAGRSPATPAAVIERATTPLQRVHRCDLAGLAALGAEGVVATPALLVVGDVVALAANDITGEHAGGLTGRTVAVTRPAGRGAADLADSLAAAGAVPVRVPLVRVVRDVDAAASRRALAGLREGAFRWVAFTSRTAVAEFFTALEAAGGDARLLGGTTVCAVGPATAEALRSRSIIADVVPPSSSGSACADAILAANREPVVGAVLLPRAAGADEALATTLREAGARVETLPLYRVEPLLPVDDDLAALRACDAITLASPSAARAWAAAGGADRPGEVPVVACFGPTTAAAATAAGLRPAVVADGRSLGGLTDALREYYGTHTGRRTQS